MRNVEPNLSDCTYKCFSKMKFVKVVLANYCFAIVEEGFQLQWRGHKVICCPNGTAIEAASRQKIWVLQKSEICDATVDDKNSGVA